MGWYMYWLKRNHIPKKLCSELYCLDSFSIFKENLKNLHITKLGVFAHLQGDRFIGHCNGMPFSLRVEAQDCNYGGKRHFFLCSSCSSRMRKVYFSHGAFHCRNCLGLGYLSQRLRASDSFLKTKRKIVESLEEKFGSEYQKPPRMWNRTFQRKLNRIEICEQKAYFALLMEQKTI